MIEEEGAAGIKEKRANGFSFDRPFRKWMIFIVLSIRCRSAHFPDPLPIRGVSPLKQVSAERMLHVKAQLDNRPESAFSWRPPKTLPFSYFGLLDSTMVNGKRPERVFQLLGILLPASFFISLSADFCTNAFTRNGYTCN